jgi:hypothetical protein
MEFLYIIAIAAMIWYGRKEAKRPTRKEKRDAQILEANQRYGTKFNPKDDCLGYIDSVGVLFDPTARKICIITKGVNVDIEDFSYIRTWELKWTEHPGSSVFRYRNVQMVIHTNDYQTPMIIVGLDSMRSGEFWHSRLGILFP